MCDSDFDTIDFETIDYDPPLPQDYDSLATTAHDRLEYLRMCCCQNAVALLLDPGQQEVLASDLALLLHRSVDEHRKRLTAELEAIAAKLDPDESPEAPQAAEHIRDLAAAVYLGNYGYE